MIRNSRLLRPLLRLVGRPRFKPRPPRVKYGVVEVSPYLNDAKAAASISADFELAWAWREWGVERAERMGFLERRNVPLILDLLDEFDVPITWATVGHLFLDSCNDRKNGLVHSHMPRPQANRRWEGDWYKHDPSADVATRPAWYCPDLIRLIQQAKVPHEIGCHSFSHIEFSRECSNEELIRAEIHECQEVMARFDLRPHTLVYPFNIMGHHHLDLLSRLGVVVVRHRDAKFGLSYPERDPSGVYKIYETMSLRESTYYSQPAKALALLEEAVGRGLCYHLWFHPSNPTAEFQITFREILEHMVMLRKRGDLWVATMKDLAAYCEARRTTIVKGHWDTSKLTLSFLSTYDRSKFGPTELTLRVHCPNRPSKAKLMAGGTSKVLPDPRLRYCGKSGTLTVNVPSEAESLELSFHAPQTSRERANAKGHILCHAAESQRGA